MAKPKEQEPDERPKWLLNVQAEGTQQGELVIDGNPYQYTIVKPELAPLPYTVGFPNENALFISVDVPEKYRPFILAHEVREKTTFANRPEIERCKASLLVELQEAEEILKDEFNDYVNNRKNFFDALVAHYEQPKQRQAVTEDFVKSIQASRDYLNGLNIELDDSQGE